MFSKVIKGHTMSQKSNFKMLTYVCMDKVYPCFTFNLTLRISKKCTLLSLSLYYLHVYEIMLITNDNKFEN